MPENAVAPAAPDDDRTPTQEDVPVAMPEAAWKMPEPVFRRSDGHTPAGRFTGNEDETVTPDSIPPDTTTDEEPTAEAAATDAGVADQPELHEESESETAAAPAEPAVKKKTGWFRILLVVLAVVLVALAAATVIFGIALGYFFQVSESQNLN